MNNFLCKSVQMTLKHQRICDLTGRLMLPGEKIIILPKYKKMVIIPLIYCGKILFFSITIVPFIPDRDYDLYRRKKTAMVMITNLRP
jgi:hypothetical protein